VDQNVRCSVDGSSSVHRVRQRVFGKL